MSWANLIKAVSSQSTNPIQDKTATVERKVPVKDELDAAVPQHELLDISVNKAKSDLVSRGGLAKRQLPSGKKSLSNSSSDCALNESGDESATETTSLSNSNVDTMKLNGHYSVVVNNVANKKRLENSSTSAAATAAAAAAAAAAPLYAQVHKDRDANRTIEPPQSVNNHYISHSTIPNIYKNTNDSTALSSASYNNELNSSYDSILGSNDKLSDSAQSTENWMYPSRRRSNKIPPSSFTDQLNQVLSEREQ